MNKRLSASSRSRSSRRSFLAARNGRADMKKPEISFALAALLVLAGCVSSSHARKVTPSGFLGDSASLLKKGGKDDVLLVYHNEKTDWASYDKIILDPVTIWGRENSKL